MPAELSRSELVNLAKYNSDILSKTNFNNNRPLPLIELEKNDNKLSNHIKIQFMAFKPNTKKYLPKNF